MNDVLLTRLTLFINENGRIVCLKHGGSYLQSAVKNAPAELEYSTPLDHWLRIPDYNADCEDC